MASVHDRAVDINRAAAVMADSSRPLSRPPTAASHTFTPSGGRRSNPFFSYATPSRRATRAKDDPEQLAQFFRARSAKLDSPIFRRKRVDHGCTFPEVRLGPRFRETSSVPPFFPHENILDYTFEPVKREPFKIVDLGHKVARNPLPYSILLRQSEESNIYPVQVRLKPNPEKCKNMFVLARPPMGKEEEEEMVRIESESIAKGINPPEPHQPYWELPYYGESSKPAAENIEVKFWAAPCEEGIRGTCVIEIIIVDNKGTERSLELPFTAIGCKPELKLSGPGLQTTEKRRARAIGNSIKVELSDDTITQPIYLKNESSRGCSVLAAVYLTNDGSIRNQEAPFLLLDMESCENTKAIVKVLEPGATIEMAIELKVPMGEGLLIPPKFLGTVNVRVAYFLNNKPKTDAELPQYFDQIIYLEAPRPDGVPLVASPTTTIQEDHQMLGLGVHDNFPTALDFGDDERSFGSFQGPTMTDHMFVEQRESENHEKDQNSIPYETPRVTNGAPPEVEAGKNELNFYDPDDSSEETSEKSDVPNHESNLDHSSNVRNKNTTSPNFHDPTDSSDGTTVESSHEFDSNTAKRDGHNFYKTADSSDATTSEDIESEFSDMGDLTPDTNSDGSGHYNKNDEATEFDDTEDNCINLDQIGEMPTPFKNPQHLSPTQQETPKIFKGTIPTLPEDMGTPMFNTNEPDAFSEFVNSAAKTTASTPFDSPKSAPYNPSASSTSPNKTRISYDDEEDVSEQPQFPNLNGLQDDKFGKKSNRAGSVSEGDAINERNNGDKEPESKSTWENSPTDIKEDGLKPPGAVKLKILWRVRDNGVRLLSNREYVTFKLSNARDYAITVMVQAVENVTETAESFLKLGPRESGRFHLMRRADVAGEDSLRVSAYPEDNIDEPVGGPVVYMVPITVEPKT